MKRDTDYERGRHQVLIVGGSLAGAACAIALCQAGVDAIALDRGEFPRRKVCGGFLSPGAIRCLDDLGVLAALRSRGAVGVAEARLRLDHRCIEIPFDSPGLGVSRELLDQILAEAASVRFRSSVERVEPLKQGFRVFGAASDGKGFRFDADIVIDAAGSLSRLSRRRTRPQFGVQYYEQRSRSSTLEFSFFQGGYGGSVSVDGGRTNSCFLVDKSRLGGYLEREGCIVTGSVGYTRTRGPCLAVGDAGGLIDPFCGEGIRHALESGKLAGRIVADGLDAGHAYSSIRKSYDRSVHLAWRRKRAVASMLRWVLDRRSPRWAAFALGGRFQALVPTLLHQLWS